MCTQDTCIIALYRLVKDLDKHCSTVVNLVDGSPKANVSEAIGLTVVK